MFQSPYSSEEDDCKRDVREEYPFPFYPTICEPHVYYAEVATKNVQKSRKVKEKKRQSNCFVRAFHWYTRDITQTRTGAPPQNPQSKGADDANFAKWLDDKYKEYLKSNNASIKPRSLISVTDVENGKLITPGCKCDTCTERHKHKTRGCCKEPIEFILKPQSFSQPTSDCGRQSIPFCGNRSNATVVIKSRSSTGTLRTAYNTPQLGANTFGESSKIGIIQHRNASYKLQVNPEKTLVDMKEVDIQYIGSPKVDAASQYSAASVKIVECPECVYRFIRNVAEEPLLAIKNPPEPMILKQDTKHDTSNSSRLKKIPTEKFDRNGIVMCQCGNENDKSVNCNCIPPVQPEKIRQNQHFKSTVCRCSSKINTKQVPSVPHILTTNKKNEIRSIRCYCPNKQTSTYGAQYVTDNNKNGLMFKHEHTRIRCPCTDKRGSCFKYFAETLITNRQKQAESQTATSMQCTTPNIYYSHGSKNEPCFKNQINYPVSTLNNKDTSTTTRTSSQHDQRNKLSLLLDVSTSGNKYSLSRTETYTQTSDHSIIFHPETNYPLYLRITCADKLNE